MCTCVSHAVGTKSVLTATLWGFVSPIWRQEKKKKKAACSEERRQKPNGASVSSAKSQPHKTHQLRGKTETGCRSAVVAAKLLQSQ